MEKPKSPKLNILTYIQASDHFTFNWCMQRKHQKLLTSISRWASKTADGFYYPAVPLALWFSGSPSALPVAIALSLAFALERPLYLFLKRICKRNRPADILPGFKSFIIPSDKFSFPSGHTSGAFLFATIVAEFFPVLFPLCFFWATSVALSRIFLGVHFPTDTLVGAVVGCSIGLFVLSFLFISFV